MTKRIEVTEYQCNPTTFDLEEFVTAQTIDGMGNILGLDAVSYTHLTLPTIYSV